MMRRIPKRGFTHLKERPVIINVGKIDAVFSDGDTVTLQALVDRGLVDAGRKVKILGAGTCSKKLRVELDALSAGARARIEKAGGSVAGPAGSKKSEKNVDVPTPGEKGDSGESEAVEI